MTKVQALSFVRQLRTQRRNVITDLREENAELIKIIADYDKRLAQVEAERDELQVKLANCHSLMRATPAQPYIQRLHLTPVGWLP